MSHALNLEDHKSIQKDGAVKTNVSVLTKHLLSGESYKLTRAKVFDMQWSSIVKGLVMCYTADTLYLYLNTV